MRNFLCSEKSKNKLDNKKLLKIINIHNSHNLNHYF